MALTQVSSNKCAGGFQKVFEHDRWEQVSHTHTHTHTHLWSSDFEDVCCFPHAALSSSVRWSLPSFYLPKLRLKSVPSCTGSLVSFCIHTTTTTFPVSDTEALLCFHLSSTTPKLEVGHMAKISYHNVLRQDHVLDFITILYFFFLVQTILQVMQGPQFCLHTHGRIVFGFSFLNMILFWCMSH